MIRRAILNVLVIHLLGLMFSSQAKDSEDFPATFTAQIVVQILNAEGSDSWREGWIRDSELQQEMRIVFQDKGITNVTIFRSNRWNSLY